MAHFAKLDDNGIVLDVVVVSNDIAIDEDAGVSFLIGWSGGWLHWKQCSYNGTIRKQYAGIGYTYDPIADVFIAPQPFPSWALDANHDWQPPVPKPDGYMPRWDEATLSWVAS